MGPIKTDIPLTTTEIPTDGDNSNNKTSGPSGPKTYTRKNDPTMPPDPNNKAGGTKESNNDFKQKLKNSMNSSVPNPKKINLGNSGYYEDGTPNNSTNTPSDKSTPTNTTTPVNEEDDR
ncbi:MAG: hypothetical protein M0D57_08630 [Sphingobacteriales bacterium JAD_PAG50586_3]|nr:MAG: hypothetical protein M0D57_08630 [Sphingobacteriales bacterium JAD_PAG50586_3]